MRLEAEPLFATRAPHRPNQLGLSAVEITHVDHASGRIGVRGLDLLDGTPVLDLKPYVKYADSFPEARAGWIDALEGPADGPDRLSYWPPPAHLMPRVTGSTATGGAEDATGPLRQSAGDRATDGHDSQDGQDSQGSH